MGQLNSDGGSCVRDCFSVYKLISLMFVFARDKFSVCSVPKSFSPFGWGLPFLFELWDVFCFEKTVQYNEWHCMPLIAAIILCRTTKVLFWRDSAVQWVAYSLQPQFYAEHRKLKVNSAHCYSEFRAIAFPSSHSLGHICTSSVWQQA